MTDFAHSAQAERNRQVKAAALASAARRLGLASADLAVDAGGRRVTWKAAGLTRSPGSEDTWLACVELLSVDDPPGNPPSQSCRNHPSRPAHLYLAGWLCDSCSPWAVAGRPRPTPPPGTTLIDQRAARAAARAAAMSLQPATAARSAPTPPASNTALYQATRAAQAHHRSTHRARGPAP